MTDYDGRAERAEVETEFDTVPAEGGPDGGGGGVSTVVSVRLRSDELAMVEKAAAAAGVPLSTFIRQAALGAVGSVDVRAISARAEAIQNQADQLVTMLRRGAA